MMDKFEIQKLRDIPIEDVAMRLGITVSRHKALCPFHDDHHASLSFSPRKNSCRCFVCMEQQMGTIDLVMRLRHLDFRAACRWLGYESYLDDPPARPPAPTQQKPKENKFDASRYWRFFEHPWLNEEARHFLFDERRLDPRVVAWCRITSWKDREGTAWLQTPYYSMEGGLIGVQNRRLSGNEAGSGPGNDAGSGLGNDAGSGLGNAVETTAAYYKPRFRFPSGSQCSIYNLPVLRMASNGEDVFITEGCSDCWAMLSAGHKAVAVPSATLLGQSGKELLLRVTEEKHLCWHMFPDRDAPGERLFLQLKELLPGIEHLQLPQGCKDFAEYYCRSRGRPPGLL